ncbi:hypothetical protein ODJ79_04530 [Actinoplanes sp. KI2]|uniref:hypothetical protein n=1 Tax=Actinoplanes sp. KI2 TaxID=2983315 RepID=UPI0021D6091E|nr:hypothetical protein [Actinoplanes sp. KI2]MCU7722973.1 hypothetical protein [Actinoplanes sp. KI2]
MRRTLLFTAGLMVAAGTSLALAGPASAAPASCCYYPSSTHNTGILSPNTNVQLANLSTVVANTNLSNIGNPTTSVFGNAYGSSGGSIYSNTYLSQHVNQYANAGQGNGW